MLRSSESELSANDADQKLSQNPEQKIQGTNHYQNALNSHLCFFKGKGGVITAESIYAGLSKLGVKNPSAIVLSKVILSEASFGCPHANFFGGGRIERADFLKLIHPFDTGIFKKENGSFDEGVFNKLASYAIVDKQTGQKVISLVEIHKFKEKDSKPERWKDAGNIEKLIGFTGTKGEFSLLFSILSDVNINGMPYITISRLKRFYTEGYTLFTEIAAAENLKKQIPKKEGVTERRQSFCDSIRSSCTIM